MIDVVVCCFDLSGEMARPWIEAGFECHAVDVQRPEGRTVDGGLVSHGMDVFDWEPIFEAEVRERGLNVIFAAFFPPCTDLAVSGARWFAQKEIDSPGTRARAMRLIHWSDRAGRAFGCPYFIENPVSVISSEWRKPDWSFHPHEYGGYRGGEGDGYTKKTCLWSGGGFSLPPKRPIELDPATRDRIWKMAPSAERQNERSKTPRGFARAVFEHLVDDF